MQVFEDTVTPNPEAVWRVACKGLHHHRTSSQRCSKTNITNCPHQQKLLLDAPRCCIEGVSTTAHGHPSCVRKPGQGGAQEMELSAQRSPAGDVWGPSTVPVPKQPLNKCLVTLMKYTVCWAAVQTQAWHKDYPTKNSSRNAYKHLESWERHGLGEEEKREADRQAPLSVALGWDSSAICPSAALQHPALIHRSSSDINFNCLQQGKEGKWSPYSGWLCLHSSLREEDLLSLLSSKSSHENLGHIIMLFITSH